MGWHEASPGGACFSPPFMEKAQAMDFSYLTSEWTTSGVQTPPVLSVIAVGNLRPLSPELLLNMPGPETPPGS